MKFVASTVIESNFTKTSQTYALFYLKFLLYLNDYNDAFLFNIFIIFELL